MARQTGFEAAVLPTAKPYMETRGVLVPDDHPLDRMILTDTIRGAILSDTFEADEIRFLPRFLSAGDRVLEIGAGIGVVGTVIARHPGVEKLVSVEANPVLMPFMARVHGLNGAHGIDRRNVVLTTGPERARSFYIRQDFWMSSLCPGPEPFISEIDVATAPLNPLLMAEDINVIVCDIEGGEVDLFAGAELCGVDRIFIEVHDHLSGLNGVTRLFRTLMAKGFGYDPRASCGSVILFRRLSEPEVLRPYEG